MSNFAIKGHSTRGKEIIEILQMFGGTNKYNITYTEDNLWYCLRSKDNVIIATYPNSSIKTVLSIEEFLEKFPYKVGDKVKIAKTGKIVSIEDMSWRNESCEVVYETCYNNDCVAFYSAIELQHYKEFISEEIFTTWKKYSLPEGYEFHDDKGNVINTSTIELVKKQSEYPKTFIEILNFWHPDRQIGDDYQRWHKKDLIEKFQDLLYARDAYWKIYGEQMGFGKPWDSKYGCGEWGYWIGYNINENKIYCQDSRILLNRLLVFPTAEMRDAFYENFKELIESCKELL